MKIDIPSVVTMFGLLPFLASSVSAQQKERRQVHLNVFRVDAAVVAAQTRGLFASEGIAVKITRMVAADLKLSPKAAAGSVAELSANGSLNVPGLESVLSLRTQFGFTPPMGPAIATYYDLDYYRAAAGR